MIAGIDYATGYCIVCMDADLQHPPESIPEIIQKFRDGYDVVSMIRLENADAGFIKRLTSGTLLAKSEFIIMPNQASTDRIELAKLLNISDLQMSYITNVGAGQGLLKVGRSLVPFVNKFPHNTELYKLMTTRFGEV